MADDPKLRVVQRYRMASFPMPGWRGLFFNQDVEVPDTYELQVCIDGEWKPVELVEVRD